MPDDDPPQAALDPDPATLLVLKAQEARLARLEEDATHKTLSKRLTAGASGSALFLGLVLTFVSLYHAFVTKPEADRISRISQFNQVVNSISKVQVEGIDLQARMRPGAQLAVGSLLVPQILNDLATARAMLRTLDKRDVGVPQLIVLVSAALDAGDPASAKKFVTRALAKTDVPPMQHSEAERYAGQYWFSVGDPVRGRHYFEAALHTLGSAPAATRAYDLSNLVSEEYEFGMCKDGQADFEELANTLKSPQMSFEQVQQLAGAIQTSLEAMDARGCPLPAGLSTLGAR